MLLTKAFSWFIFKDWKVGLLVASRYELGWVGLGDYEVELCIYFVLIPSYL